MAESLSNEIYINLSSDNIPEHYCDPCYEIKDEIKPIAGHCIDCGESLCVECFNNHLGPKPSRNHKLVDTSAKPPIKQKRKAKEMKTGEKCSVHGSIIQSFCTSHSELCCMVCRTINHKTCELEEISETARHLQNSQELQILNKKLKKIHKGFEDNLRKTGHHEMTIQKNFTNAINKMKKLRDEIDNLLRETEKLAEEVQKEDFRIIETVSSTCNIVIEQINSITSNLHIMNKNKENARLFIFMKRAESQLQSLQESLATLDNDNTVREYIFEPDEKIHAMMRDLKVLGHLNYTGQSKSQQISKTKQNVDDSVLDDSVLGPGIGASRLAYLDKTSVLERTTSRPSQYKEKTEHNTLANRFIALSKPDEDSSRRYGDASPVRGDQRVRDDFGRLPSFNARKSQENEREKAVAAAKAIFSSQSQNEGNQERSKGRDINDKPVTPVAPAPKEFTEAEIEKKTKTIVDEYLQIQDIQPVNAGAQQYTRSLSTRSTDSQDSSGFDRTPKYVWQSAEQGQGGGGGGRDIELHHAETAWQPGTKKDKDGKGTDKVGGHEDEDAKTEELYRKTRSVLNKLTPQMFKKLVKQMQALPIDTDLRLKGVIDLVFEKAVSEPNYSVAYANMCRCLSMIKVPSETKKGEIVNFRAILLTRCQREFEKDKSSLFVAKREEIEKAEESQKAELKAKLAYDESNAQKRSLGNIRFIGELFKLKMLTENLMHDCVYKLLRTKDPKNLECLCRLLTTIGKKLDTDNAKPRMDQYFQQIIKIVNDKKISSRVRIMLQDVMDVRTNKWVSRRADDNPKTIDQIHKEMQQENQEKALFSQHVKMQQSSGRGGGGQGGGGGGGRRAGPQGQMGGGGSDGWNTVGGSRTPLRYQNVDATVQLGPGVGASIFAGWGRGSTGGTTGRHSHEKQKPEQNTLANRFSALSRPDEDCSRRYSGASPVRGDPRGLGFFGRPPSLNARQSQENEREKAVAAANHGCQFQDGGHRERSRGRDLGDKPVTPSARAPKELTEAEMEEKTKAIVDEYLQIQDIKEAIECVKELPNQNHPHFVFYSLYLVLERSTVARKQTGHILHDIVKEKVVSVDNYIKGLLLVLEMAEDLEIDIPKIWKYYGELISPMIQDSSVSLSFLKRACEPIITSNKAGILLAEILHDASQRMGHKKIGGLWQSSGLQWSDFMPKHQVDEFLADKKLEFTKGGDSAPTTPTTGLPLADISEKLHELIVVRKTNNAGVFDWIETNVDEPRTKQTKFIRALMTAVCNSAISGDKGKERVDPSVLTSRHDLLQNYLDHQPVSELHGLYALQALVTKLKHPRGVLRTIFDTLYDEDIISEAAFIQWKKSKYQPEGKDATLKQVVPFFTWLKEAEDENDS